MGSVECCSARPDDKALEITIHPMLPDEGMARVGLIGFTKIKPLGKVCIQLYHGCVRSLFLCHDRFGFNVHAFVSFCPSFDPFQSLRYSLVGFGRFCFGPPVCFFRFRSFCFSSFYFLFPLGFPRFSFRLVAYARLCVYSLVFSRFCFYLLIFFVFLVNLLLWCSCLFHIQIGSFSPLHSQPAGFYLPRHSARFCSAWIGSVVFRTFWSLSPRFSSLWFWSFFSCSMAHSIFGHAHFCSSFCGGFEDYQISNGGLFVLASYFLPLLAVFSSLILGLLDLPIFVLKTARSDQIWPESTGERAILACARVRTIRHFHSYVCICTNLYKFTFRIFLSVQGFLVFDNLDYMTLVLHFQKVQIHSINSRVQNCSQEYMHIYAGAHAQYAFTLHVTHVLLLICHFVNISIYYFVKKYILNHVFIST